MKDRILLFLLVLLPVSEVLAKTDYTYIKSSLAYPWVVFFVIFALISIPFIMVVVLAWRKSATAANGAADAVVQGQSPAPAQSHQKGPFNRIVLPAILVSVVIFSILLVLNAYEAMDLMETTGLAAPTMLNPRPE